MQNENTFYINVAASLHILLWMSFSETFQQFINNATEMIWNLTPCFFAKRADLPEEYPDAPAYLDVGFALGSSLGHYKLGQL